MPEGAFDESAVHGRRETAVQPVAAPAASFRGWTRLSRPAASQSLSNRFSARSTQRSTTVFAGFHSISAYERPVAPTSRNSSTTSSFHSRSSRCVSVCHGDGVGHVEAHGEARARPERAEARGDRLGPPGDALRPRPRQLSAAREGSGRRRGARDDVAGRLPVDRRDRERRRGLVLAGEHRSRACGSSAGRGCRADRLGPVQRGRGGEHQGRPDGQHGRRRTHGGCYLSGSPWQRHAFRTMF